MIEESEYGAFIKMEIENIRDYDYFFPYDALCESITKKRCNNQKEALEEICSFLSENREKTKKIIKGTKLDNTLPPFEKILFETSIYKQKKMPSSGEIKNKDTVSFSSEIEETVNVILNLNGRKDPKGLVLQRKLTSQKFGFAKDIYFSSLINRLYLKSGSKDVKTLFSSWLWLKEESTLQFFLKVLNPPKEGSERFYESKLTYPSPYYKISIQNIIKRLNSNSWYSVDDLFSYYKEVTAPFKFCIKDENRFCFIRNDDIRTLDKKDITAEIEKYEEDIIIKPYFLAYLYVFSFFGVIDIVEEEPELKIITKGRKLPYSPFHALKYISLTEYGRYILGLRDDKPEIKRDFSLPILDKDLLLITYKGESVELRSFFSYIADPLGPVRYKVSLKSFTKNIETEDEAKALIEKFKGIFPFLPHVWTSFFSEVLSSFKIFTRISSGSVYSIRQSDKIYDLLKEEEIRKYVVFLEDGFIYIANKDYKRLVQELEKRGYKDSFVLS